MASSCRGTRGFETLAGFILFKLGSIPAPGDSVTYEQHTFTVQQMDRNRIARVKIVTQRPSDAASTATQELTRR
ncbi:MAG: transporter associated domain-containing protein [Acidobacteriota bacterium]